MKIIRLAVTAAALLLSLPATVQAQTTLRIGLAEDPDILDPTLARTYVGRIVFAAFSRKTEGATASGVGIKNATPTTT